MNVSSQQQWQRNKFLKFYAKMKIRVGGSAVPIDIMAGDEFLYDGTVLKYGGSEFTSPQTRGAINMGWASLKQGSDEPIQGRSSNRSVAKATSVNRDLSRVQRSEPQSIPTDMSDEDTVMNVSDRRPQNAGPRVHNVPSNNAQPRVMQSARNMTIHSDISDGQEGVTVGRVRTAAKLKADVLSSAGAGLASSLENISGSGLVPEGSNRARGHNVIQREGVTVRTNVTSGRVGNIEMSDMDEGQVVGKVRQSRNHSTEGVTVTDTSNIREERARAERAAKPRVVQKDVKTVKVAAKPVVNPAAAKLKTAKGIDPTFPEDWNFFAKLPDRMAIIKKKASNKKFLRALYVVEGDSIRRHLEKEYPKLFG